MKKEPADAQLVAQIGDLVAQLPEELTPNQVEALLMTIAQGYAPDHETAAVVLVNAGITLKAIADMMLEAKNATIN